MTIVRGAEEIPVPEANLHVHGGAISFVGPLHVEEGDVLRVELAVLP